MKTITLKNENIVHVVEEYDLPRYEMIVLTNAKWQWKTSTIVVKYEAFVLGAYIHSFSISKTGDHRCRFDSGTLGFIGVPKGTNPDEIAEELTAACNGEYDNLTDDSICSYDYNELEKWKEEARSKYNIQ